MPDWLSPIRRLADRLLATPALACFSVIGLALRAALTLRYADVKDLNLWEFGVIAKNLHTTGVYAYFEPSVPTAYMPPAYPLLISALYRILGMEPSANLALLLILLAFQAGTCLLLAWIASIIWGRTAARIAFLLAAFWPMYLVISVQPSNVAIYSALLILAVGAFVAPIASLPRKGALCGLALGLYALNRFEALLLLPAFLVGLLAAARASLRTGLGAAAALLLSFGLVISPWLVRNWLTFERLTFGSAGGYGLLRGHHDRATGGARDPWPAGLLSPDVGTPVPTGPLIESLTFENPQDEFIADDWYLQEAIRYIRTHPGRELELAARKLFFFLTVDWTHPMSREYLAWMPSLVALGIGFLHWARQGRRDLRQNFLWLIFATQLGISVIFFVLPRYRIAVDFVPLLFLAAWSARVLGTRPRAAT